MAAGGLAVGVLGALRVTRDRNDVALRSRVHRTLLLRLVVGPGAVSVDELVDAVWGASPPQTAASTLKSHLSRLRAELRPRAGFDPIASHPGGYRLAIADDAVDAVRFERAVRDAGGRPPYEAAERLREGIALWRGPAYADVRHELFAAGEITRLEALRLLALEDRIAADMALGNQRSVIPELQALVGEQPLRERAAELLMRALHADARSRDALQAYETLRTALRETAGLDPGPAVTLVRDAILRGEPLHDLRPGSERPAVRYARTAAGAAVGYTVRGTGPPWILAVGADAHLSIATLDDEPRILRSESELASIAGLVRCDRPGVGLSDPPGHGGPPTTDDWAEAALATADAAGLATFTVLGAGWSAPAALRLAAAHPDRATTAIIFNGFARFLRAPDYPIGLPPQLLDGFIDSVLDTDAATMPRDLDDVLLHAPSLAHDTAFRAWWRRSGQQSASPATSRAHFALLHADVRHLLPGIRQPVLVVHRRDNRYVRLTHARYLADRLPDGRLVVLDGADQLLGAGDATDALRAIGAFLRAPR
jgi:DNA-binding SARP family transcriptional activator/pimeloyl-ACP methyl ester carboxylesterase